MKKIFSTVILVLLLFNNLQIAQIYADSDANLELEKQKNIVLLDKVGDLTSTIIDKIDNKIIDEESSQRLREKEIEIEKYIEDTKKQIENESSKGDIKELTEDVANVVVLKVVSGVTKYQDIEDNLGTDIKKEDKKEALETIQESLSEGDYYNLIIKTILSKEEILNRYKRFDEKLKVDFLYNDDKNNYYEFFISNDSIFRREMLEDIESGNIPDTFLGVEIVKPEVFAVESLELKQSSSVPLVNKLIQLGTVKIPDNLTKVGVINTEIDYVDSLKGENLDLTWGVNKFNLFSQLSVIKSTNKKIKVGVVDTGIDYNHPDLKGKVSKGYDFVNNDDDALDDQGHGTHVAGTIGANINGAGIIGVNPYVEFVPLKICNSKGFCPSYAVIKALEYSKENKLDVLNMSLGGAGDPKTSPICDGIDSVTKEGIIVVSASGNSNIDTNTFVPGGCGSAITVAAVDENFKRATFSNYGTKVDVSAPGVNVYSTAPNNSYRKLSGTSMATPHIVGLVSVMKSFKPELTTLEIKEIFKTKNIAVNFESGKYIAGFPDIVNILKFLQNKEEPKLVEEEKVVEDELVDEVKNEEETEDGNKIILKSQIDSNLKYEVQKIETQNEDTEILPTIENNWIEAQNIDFGDKKEFDLQISSDEGKSKIEEISINEVSEKKKMPIEFSKDKTYDANGNRLDIKINSSGDDLEEDKIIENNEENLENEKSVENEANQENEEEIIEMKDIYVDGSENLIEINSNGESEWEELEIKEKISEEENIINKTDGEELNMFDIGKFSSIDLGGEEEIKYEEDNETKIEEGSIGIQNASYPVKIEEINYIFGDLTNTQKYESYITYRGTNYSISNTGRGILGKDYLLAKKTDNSISLKTQDNYNYSENVSPTNFTGEFKANLATIDMGRGQYGNMGIIGADNSALIGVSLSILQAHGVDYRKARGQKVFCNISSSSDEYECGTNIYEKGRFLNFYYKKSNGKYSTILYKIPNNLVGEYSFSYDLNFETKELNIKIKNNSGIIENEGTIKLPNFSDYENIDFSNFKYTSSAGTTNGEEQRFYPQKIALGFGKKEKISEINEEEIKSSDKLIYINLLETKDKKVNIENHKNFDFTLKGKSNIKTFNYNYSFDGINYLKLEENKQGVEINSVGDEEGNGEGLNMFDIGKFSSIDLGGEEEIKYEEDNETKIEEGSIGIQNASYPVKIEEINYFFGDLNNTEKYESYITYRGTNYSISNTGRGILGKDYLLAKKTDNSILIKTQDNYNYLDSATPSNFTGEFKANLATIDIGRGQYGNMGIIGADNSSLIGVSLSILQAHGVDYTKARGQKVFCSISSISDEYECGTNIYEKGRFLNFYYKKSNGKYSTILYKIPNNLVGEYSFSYDLNFETKELNIKIKNNSGIIENEGTIKLPNFSDYENIDFSNFKYTSSAGTTNGEEQRFYPQKIALALDNEAKGLTEFLKTFPLDLSLKDEGKLKIFVKIDDGKIESNIVELELIKDTNYLETPTNISVNDVKYNQATYRWNDNSSGIYSEDKYVIKDEKDNVIADNLAKDSIEYIETGLKERTSYSRKICVVASKFEKCSSLINFTTLVDVKTYDVDLLVGNGGNVVLPELINQYNLSMTNGSIFLDYRGKNAFYNSNNKFSFVVYRPGISKIVLRDKVLGYEKYIINIKSKISEYDISMIKTEYGNANFSSSDNYSYTNSSIGSIRDRRIYTYKEGKTDITISRNGLIKQIIHLTVLPIPEPQVIECTTLIGDRCILDSYYSGFDYEQFPLGTGKLERGSHTFYVTGVKPGVFKVYVKKSNGNYVSHIFQVTVRSKPIQYFTCSSPQGVECNTNWRGDDKEYTYSVSDTSILALKLNRYKELLKTYERLQVTGKKPGVADVYIYENGEHIVTFTITVENPVPAISLENSSVTIKQLESKQINILNGGGDYKNVVGFDKEIISFGVDNKENNKGIIKISGLKPGKTYATLKDKYGQTISISTKVEDVVLKLGYPKTGTEEELVLNSDYEYVNIKESYRGVSKIINENDNIQAYLTKIEVNGELVEIIKVIPKKEGTSLLRVEDYEGNFEVVKVRVAYIKDEEEGESTDGSEEEASEAELDSIFKELEEFLKENGVEVNSVEEGVEVNSYQKRVLDDKKKLYDIYSKNKEKFDNLDNKLEKASSRALGELILTLEEYNKQYKYKSYQKIFNYIIVSAKEFQILNLREYNQGKKILAGETIIPEKLLLYDRIIMYKIMQYEKAPLLQKEFAPELLNALIKGTNTQIENSTKLLIIDKNLLKDLYQGMLTGYTILQNYGGANVELWKGIDRIRIVLEVLKEYDNIASLSISLFPGIGEGYDIITLLYGIDPITREHLDDFQFSLTFIGLVSGLGSGKLARDVVNSGLEKIAKELGMSISEIINIAKNVAGEYKIKSLDDLVKLKNNLNVDKFLKLVKIKAWGIKSVKIIDRLDYSKIERLEKNGIIQYIDRGWSKNLIEKIIKNPNKIGRSIDYVSNPISGDSATVFYNSFHEYVIVNDKTGLIVQISKISDLNWTQDSRIYDLIDF